MSQANGDEVGDSHVVSLADLGPGRSAHIVDIEGGREMRRRCLALGLRPGTEISISQSRRHGVVIGSDNTRVALGEGMAERVRVEPVRHEPKGVGDQ